MTTRPTMPTMPKARDPPACAPARALHAPCCSRALCSSPRRGLMSARRALAGEGTPGDAADVADFWVAVYRSFLVILFLEIGDR